MTLEDRITARIKTLGGCSHSMCSSSDEAAEHGELVSLRKLLCQHPTWKIFTGQDWEIGPFNPDDPCGCYCATCGASAREKEYA